MLWQSGWVILHSLCQNIHAGGAPQNEVVLESAFLDGIVISSKSRDCFSFVAAMEQDPHNETLARDWGAHCSLVSLVFALAPQRAWLCSYSLAALEQGPQIDKCRSDFCKEHRRIHSQSHSLLINPTGTFTHHTSPKYIKVMRIQTLHSQSWLQAIEVIGPYFHGTRMEEAAVCADSDQDQLLATTMSM